MMTKLNMGQDCLDNQSPSKPRSATSPVAMFNHLHSLTSPNNSKCPVCINSSRLILTGSDAFNQDNHSQQKSGKQVKNGKGNGHDDDDDDREELTRAPDGGFGWFVVIASFICNVIVDGVIFSFGILMREISRDLGQSKGVTASVGSLLTGFYLLVGPLVSYLSNKYGCRIVAMIGSVISCFGFVLSYYAPDILTLCFTFGVLGGVGYGFIYLPAIVMVASYFEERRAFATGIAVCGSGIGGFVMAPFTQFVLNRMGWRRCLLVLAAINLICLFIAILFRPLESHNRTRLLQQQNKQKSMLKTVQEPFLCHKSTSNAKNIDQSHVCHLHLPDSTLTPEMNRAKAASFMVSISQTKERRHSHYAASTISFAAAEVIAKSMEKFHTSQPRLLSSSEPRNDEEAESCSSTKSYSKSKVVMFDFTLLSSPSFMLFAFSGFLTLSGFFIPFMYLADRSMQLGSSPEAAALLLSVIGITNTLGRVFCGWISDRPEINALAINNFALIVGGTFTILSPLICHSYLMLVFYAFIFGFSIACFAALRSVITIDLLGLDRLTSAFGLLLLPQGIATVIGAPVAGWFYDVTGTYDASFYAAGTVILISGLICIPLPAFSRWEKQKHMA